MLPVAADSASYRPAPGVRPWQGQQTALAVRTIRLTDERYGYIHASMLPTQCLCTKLRRAARSVSRFYDEALADTGLKVAQFSLLRHLRRLDRPSISELAEAMGLDRSTLGRNLRVLEGDGLLRLTGGEDQRNRLVELTPAGLDALERGTPAWEDAQRRLAGRLGEERSGALAALLAELERLD
ncbi:Predicted nucleic-acid-binding protein, contains PIN domain [Acinetobacter baumannii]|nr:Predicted nucleic-acid-binding protein, contains PIN domain [Acinetobacter baumannii]